MTCFFCQRPKSHLELKTVLIGGDEAEHEEVEGCEPCLTKRRERIAYEEYLSDPFNASYERARAQGWAD